MEDRFLTTPYTTSPSPHSELPSTTTTSNKQTNEQAGRQLGKVGYNHTFIRPEEEGGYSELLT